MCLFSNRTATFGIIFQSTECLWFTYLVSIISVLFSILYFKYSELAVVVQELCKGQTDKEYPPVLSTLWAPGMKNTHSYLMSLSSLSYFKRYNSSQLHWSPCWTWTTCLHGRPRSWKAEESSPGYGAHSRPVALSARPVWAKPLPERRSLCECERESKLQVPLTPSLLALTFFWTKWCR